MRTPIERGVFRQRFARRHALSVGTLRRRARRLHGRARRWRDLGDRAAEVDLLLDEATARDWWIDPQRSAALVEEARGGARRDLTAAGGESEHGPRLAWRFGELATARAHLQAAVAFAEPLGEVGHELLVTSLVMLGHLLPALGEVEEAHRSLARAIERCRLVGDRVHEAAALNNQFEADVRWRRRTSRRSAAATDRHRARARHDAPRAAWSLQSGAGPRRGWRAEGRAPSSKLRSRSKRAISVGSAVCLGRHAVRWTLWCLMWIDSADAERAVATLRRRGEAPPWRRSGGVAAADAGAAPADAAESEWEASRMQTRAGCRSRSTR